MNKQYIPKQYGCVVGIVSFKGRIIVACQRAIFEIINDKLVPLRFIKV
jgi:hypothetical protein